MSQRDEDSRKNFGHGNNFHKTHDHIKGVDDVLEIDSESDSDYDEDSDCIPKTVKREYSDSKNDGSEVDPDNNQYDVLIEDTN